MKIDFDIFFGKEGCSVFCQDAWTYFKPLLSEVIENNTSIGSEGELIYLERKGFLEECYFDYNLEPMLVGDMVQGVHCTLIESTKRVLDERRLNLLTQLSNETHKSQTIENACETVVSILNRFREDVPYTLTYRLRQKGEIDPQSPAVNDEILDEIFRSKTYSDEIKYVDGIKHPVSKAVLIPIKSATQSNPFCLIIFGISPRLELNDDYKEFHILLSRFLSTIFSKIHMFETQQRDIVDRDDFISIASHEFKTPITALKLRLALTKRKIDLNKSIGPTPSEMNECIKTADQQADRLTSLVEELLDMTRIQRGKFVFSFCDMNLSDLIREVLLRSEEELLRTGHIVELEVPEELRVNWHLSRMDQVFTNLLTNTLKYAPGSRIRIKATCEFEIVRIEFSDNGPGIHEDKVGRVFERFEGGHSSARVGGLGLGLYIVKEIVKGHGGTIEVKSRLNEGTLFILCIPANPAKAC